MLHAVIMAGGAGTRFWPASRRQFPKQLLCLHGNRTMIQSTVDRLGELVAGENVLVVTNQILVEQTRAQLPNVPAEQIVGEPAKRDTAPCVGLAAALISRKDPEGIMVVMPADHVIHQVESFQRAIRAAAQMVETNPSQFVTFGIKPTYPAESFGYVERGSRHDAVDGLDVFEVSRFREKPNAELAQEFLASGDFYWNSGIFVWKAKTVFDALAEFQPQMHSHLLKIQQALGQADYQEVFEREFSEIQGISIDFAVMEKYDQISVMEAPFDWDDVGNWPAVGRLREADENGNTVLGKHVGIDTTNTIVRGEDGHLIATLGIDNCIVVQTENATLVADKSQEEKVRAIVKDLEVKGWSEYL